VRRWIGLGLFLGIGMMRCVFGLDCSGFGVEIWISWWAREERWRKDGGSQARKTLEWEGRRRVRLLFGDVEWEIGVLGVLVRRL